jgi:hypothetical protein
MSKQLLGKKRFWYLLKKTMLDYQSEFESFDHIIYSQTPDYGC